MAIQNQIYLDGTWYFLEKGTYSENTPKVFSESFAVSGHKNRQEGGMNPTEWDMTLLCLSQAQLMTLSGSWIKVSPDSRLAFSGRRLDSHMVHFNSFGPIETLNRENTLFRVPVRLGASDIGR